MVGRTQSTVGRWHGGRSKPGALRLTSYSVHQGPLVLTNLADGGVDLCRHDSQWSVLSWQKPLVASHLLEDLGFWLPGSKNEGI